jgi:transmembrane protein 126A
LQTRAAALQAGFGVVYPFILGPVASFMFATRHFTYRLPSVTENPKEVFKLWMKLTKSASTTGTAFLVINLFAGMFITYREMTEHYALNLKLAELEDKLGPMI